MGGAADPRPGEGRAGLVARALDLAESLRQDGERGEAIRTLLDALDHGEQRAQIYYRLGNLYVDGGDLGRAEYAYRRALEVDPRHVNAMHNLAVVYKRQSKVALFVKTYRESQRLALDVSEGRASSSWARRPWLRRYGPWLLGAVVLATVLWLTARAA
ncbi:MAG: tetratricopeptide repeat protein [Candidatus Bipolaricaulota bacterium]